MTVLVEGLLLLARADAGMLRLALKPMDVAQLLAEVYERTRIWRNRARSVSTSKPLSRVSFLPTASGCGACC